MQNWLGFDFNINCANSNFSGFVEEDALTQTQRP
jgi:hypothetical protein